MDMDRHPKTDLEEVPCEEDLEEEEVHREDEECLPWGQGAPEVAAWIICPVAVAAVVPCLLPKMFAVEREISEA